MAATLLEDEKTVSALLQSLRAGPDRSRRALCNQQGQVDTSLQCPLSF
jgi:hypothetical protein